MMKLEITFPILEAWTSNYYKLIITDAHEIHHYFTEDGEYDGYSHTPCIDFETGINKN